MDGNAAYFDYFDVGRNESTCCNEKILFFFFFFGNQRTGGEMKLIDFILFVCYDVRRISFSIVFH